MHDYNSRSEWERTFLFHSYSIKQTETTLELKLISWQTENRQCTLNNSLHNVDWGLVGRLSSVAAISFFWLGLIFLLLLFLSCRTREEIICVDTEKKKISEHLSSPDWCREMWKWLEAAFCRPQYTENYITGRQKWNLFRQRQSGCIKPSVLKISGTF